MINGKESSPEQKEMMPAWNRTLIAIDETETSRRALRYLGEISGATNRLEICLLHVYPEPPPFYLQEGRSLNDYQQEKEQRAQRIFTDAAGLLAQYGIQEAQISSMCRMSTTQETISKVILKTRAEGGYGTVVVGKRGVSKAEEFLFGSISNAVVRNSNNFTVWVVA